MTALLIVTLVWSFEIAVSDLWLLLRQRLAHASGVLSQ